MTKIYLVDYLGVHCGMHYYLEAFKKVLSAIPNTSITILSNYCDEKNGYSQFVNQYKGNRLTRFISLLRNLNRLRQFINKHSEGIFIYLTYGNRIDIPFMKIVSRAKHHIIDIHEAIAQNVDRNECLKLRYKELYRKRIKAVISHSGRTDGFLREYGYNSHKFNVPHFKYVFSKSYDIENIDEDILSAPDERRINILFFGNLNESKGVDILIDSVNQLDASLAERLNVIIAGKDFDGAVDRVIPKSDRTVKIIRRHINDDELIYLYQNVDYLSLPYRKTSQSGILEMAFYFKKPIIASDIPYFRKTLEEFPSFGILVEKGQENYSDTLKNIIINHDNLQFYIDVDFDRYENRKEVNRFVDDLCNWLSIK